jgi:hypothetical protein
LGVGAGVLGLENLWGALFYIIGSAFGLLAFFIVGVGLGNHKTFFYKWSSIITSSLSTNLFVRASYRGLLSYLLKETLTISL